MQVESYSFNWTPTLFKTAAGAEINLMLTKGRKRIAVEVVPLTIGNFLRAVSDGDDRQLDLARRPLPGHRIPHAGIVQRLG